MVAVSGLAATSSNGSDGTIIATASGWSRSSNAYLAPNILLIEGPRTRHHLAENLGTVGFRLDNATRAELTRHRVGQPHACP